MPYRPFLSRIQGLFGARPDAHLESIADALKNGRIEIPIQPMTDQELARALREFRDKPVSDRSVRKLGTRLKGNQA